VKALAGLVIFVVVPIAFVLYVGLYFSRKEREFRAKTPGKKYELDDLKKQMSPQAWRGWMLLIAILAVSAIALRVYTLIYSHKP
jgi:Na+/proline symporter